MFFVVNFPCVHLTLCLPFNFMHCNCPFPLGTVPDLVTQIVFLKTMQLKIVTILGQIREIVQLTSGRH